jgi:hypothetical protein
MLHPLYLQRSNTRWTKRGLVSSTTLDMVVKRKILPSTQSSNRQLIILLMSYSCSHYNQISSVTKKKFEFTNSVGSDMYNMAERHPKNYEKQDDLEGETWEEEIQNVLGEKDYNGIQPNLRTNLKS